MRALVEVFQHLFQIMSSIPVAILVCIIPHLCSGARGPVSPHLTCPPHGCVSRPRVPGRVPGSHRSAATSVGALALVAYVST